ncbi:MAG: thioesterase [Rhodoglobus sp.]|nr:thioesterase [Rhodoglobus sp.]
MFFRTVLHLLLSRRASRLDIHDVGRMRLRVLPTDLDVLGHLNNGVYLSIMDLGRMDLLIRSGAWARFRAKGFYPVMANETITFRKSLQPWQAYWLESRIVGYDAKAVYVEQRFVVDGEVYANAMTRGRFLKKSGGTVSVAELADLVGIDISTMPPPAWVARWAADVTLPSTRDAAPSEWPGAPV